MKDDKILSTLQKSPKLTQSLCHDADKDIERCELTMEELGQMDNHVWERLKKTLQLDE